MKIGCIGGGWVGKATVKLFGAENVVLYDPYIKDLDHPLFNNANGTTKEDVNSCAITFVAVPTNGLPGGKLDTSIVEEAVAWCNSPLIVIRSTVNPGTCDYLAKKYNKNIVMQPEYLGETPAHPNLQMGERSFMVIGGEPKDRQKLISLYTTVYNANVSIRQVSALEAEIIKLSENRAIGYKVMQCHELFLACQAAGVEYYTVRDTVYGDDWRFNLWFTFIYEGNLGYHSSKCLKKDIAAWCAWAESVGCYPGLTGTMEDMSKVYSQAGRIKFPEYGKVGAIEVVND